MKKMLIRITILVLFTFALTATTPVAQVNFVEEVCIEGTEPDCPPDDGSGGTQGPKQPPPPKDVSWVCRWLKIACTSQ